MPDTVIHSQTLTSMNCGVAGAQAEIERRRGAAYKGHLTRMRRRIANGVCPCCSRSFTNVHRHMETQHPDVLARVRRDEDERPAVMS